MAQSTAVAIGPEVEEYETTEDGGVVVDIEADAPGLAAFERTDIAEGHGENLVSMMDAAQAEELSTLLLDRIDGDYQSREVWSRRISSAAELLGLTDEPDAEGLDSSDYASNLNHPLMLEAMVTFVSSAMEETLPLAGPVDVARQGSARQRDPERAQKEMRVKKWGNHYLSTALPNWTDNHGRVLWDCGFSGFGVKKVYKDPADARAPAKSIRVPFENLIISYNAEGPNQGRVTHRIIYTGADLMREIERGRYMPAAVHTSEGHETSDLDDMREDLSGIHAVDVEFSEIDLDAPHEIMEVHCDLRLSFDPHVRGLPRPYIVSIHRDTGRLMAVRRNWREGDPEEQRVEHFVIYVYLPGQSSVYGIGLAQLLSNPTQALRDAMRAGLTAADLANKPIGIVLSGFGASLRERDLKLKPGEFVEVDMPAGAGASKPFDVFPFKGADQSLVQFIEMISGDAERLASTVSMNIAENAGPNQPVGTTLAAFDAATTIPRHVHRNLYRAMALELRLIREHAADAIGDQDITFNDGQDVLRAGDLHEVMLVPAMKPGSVSRLRRAAEAQTVLDMAERHPDLHDMNAVVRWSYTALGIEGFDEFMPAPEQATPADPVSEFNMALKAAPLAAGLHQNHAAHIDAHASSIQMLEGGMAEQIGPNGARAVALLQAHIGDHVAQDVLMQVANGLGLPPDMVQQGLPPELETRIAPAVAQTMRAIADSMSGAGGEPLPVTLERIKGENRVMLERIKGENSRTIEAMRARREMEKQRVGDDADYVQSLMEEAAQTRRNDDDNETAIFIAGMGSAARNVPATDRNPGRGAPHNNPSPEGAAQSRRRRLAKDS